MTLPRAATALGMGLWATTGDPAAAMAADDRVPGAIARVAEEAPPTIDGVLDDAAWDRAPPTGRFVERSPKLGAIPPVATTFRVLMDADAIYFAVRCDDPVASGVRARTRRRDDGAIFDDDAISIKIDAQNDRRTTLGFVVNPGGALLDYRGINESEFLIEYDMVWAGAARRDARGWTAELRIPWSALGIDPAAPPAAIGLNLTRDHSRRTATYDWSLLTPPFSPIAASRYGRLEGLTAVARVADPDRGPIRSFVLLPYGITGFRRAPGPDAETPTRTSLLNGGIDAKLDLDGFRAHASVNTDFAQVDLDNQVVNLTRFGLFLPEKRDFFLEDLEVFSFGEPQRAQMLYTRRIGLGEAAEPIPLLGGLKVIGRPAPGVRLGVLQVTTRPQDGTPWTSHAVARGLVEVDDQGSNVGVMATQRQSLDLAADQNAVVGVDGAYRRSGHVPLVVSAYGMGSVTGRDAAPPAVATGADEPADRRLRPGGGVTVALREQFIRPRLTYRAYDPKLRADLGFFRRVGVHEGEASLELEPRIDAGGINRINTGLDGAVEGSFDGRTLLDWRWNWFAQLRTTAGYVVGFRTTRRFEAVQRSFAVGRTTEIPPGDYRMWDVGVYGSTPSTYALSLGVDLTGRDYYGGRLLEADTTLAWAPDELLRLDVGGIFSRIEFPDRLQRPNFDSLVVNGRATLGFSPVLSLRFFGGYNLLDDVLRVQSRLRWIYVPGADLFVVAQADVDDDRWLPRFSSVIVKSQFRWH
ncbi:MAG: DUF5916 domain-containing protein [Myxococcota bacterium]